MEIHNVPNWIRIILIVLSVLSFVPQFSRTIARRRSSGISTYYVLFNLISATEQFALAFYFVVNDSDQSDFFVHRPVNAGDWTNLTQTAVLALLWLAFLVACLYLPSEHRDGSVKFAIGAYIAFLVLSIVPVFADAISHEIEENRRWPMMLFFGVHSMFLSWVITGFNIAAIYFQVKDLRSRPQEQALSHLGLAIQSAVFILLAGSWIGRVQFPYRKFGGFPWQDLSSWYTLVGWAAVDTAVFAFGQAIILWLVCRNTGSNSGVSHGETEPLLRA